MRFVRLVRLLVLIFVFGVAAPRVQADIIAAGFFSGTIERFNEQTLGQSTFSVVANAGDTFPGLSGVAYNSATNQIFASARISHRIYVIDGATGLVSNFHQLPDGSNPAGLALDPSGNLYVANNGLNTVSVFNPSFTLIDTITLPDVGLGNNLPSFVAFDNSQRLVISTFAGAGLFRYDPVTDAVTPFISSPLANSQIAIDGSGNMYVGSAAAASDVRKFDSAASQIGNPFLTVDASILPQPTFPYASPDFTSPSGIVLDSDGNLIVAALGRTNPFMASDNFQNNGGLFRFSPTGTLLSTFGTGLTPLSSAALIPVVVPEPSTIVPLAIAGIIAAYRARRRRRS